MLRSFGVVKEPKGYAGLSGRTVPRSQVRPTDNYFRVYESAKSPDRREHQGEWRSSVLSDMNTPSVGAVVTCAQFTAVLRDGDMLVVWTASVFITTASTCCLARLCAA